MSDETNEKKNEELKNDVSDYVKVVIAEFDKKLEEEKKKQDEELKKFKDEIKEENKKLLQSVLMSKQAPKEDEKTEEKEEDEFEDDDHSLQAIENRTKKDLLIKFGLIKLPKK